jgi:hypothetical protein
LAATGRRRKDNQRTAEWTVTNGHETLHGANFSELRKREVRLRVLAMSYV